MTLDADQRRALAVLADTGRDGAGEAIMAARFEVEVMAGLVRPRMGERGSRNGARRRPYL